MLFTASANGLLPVSNVDATRSGCSSVGRLHRCCDGNGALGSIPYEEEFAAYYPLADLIAMSSAD